VPQGLTVFRAVVIRLPTYLRKAISISKNPLVLTRWRVYFLALSHFHAFQMSTGTALV